MDHSSTLPIWLEYLKALSTPIVALIAACIASAIAYRQWVTARNKLKLDLFDRRMHIYSSAIDAIRWMAQPTNQDSSAIIKLAEAYANSKWLFDEEIAEYMKDLYHRAINMQKRSFEFDPDLSPSERTQIVFKKANEAANQIGIELNELDRRFGPYLKIAH